MRRQTDIERERDREERDRDGEARNARQHMILFRVN